MATVLEADVLGTNVVNCLLLVTSWVVEILLEEHPKHPRTSNLIHFGFALIRGNNLRYRPHNGGLKDNNSALLFFKF